MAEFSYVMRQWSRMCGAMLDREGKCENCGLLKTYRVCCGVPNAATSEDFAEVERVVMAYAAEHPEPVYPTWKEWLEEQRVVVHFDSVSEKGTKVKWELTNKSNCRIPADIAEKLGIEPKEG